MTPEEIQEHHQIEERLDNLATDIVNLRHRDLLVLYYPDGADIENENIEHIYDEFITRHALFGQSVPLDVLIHTQGGDPDAAYMVAQVIRNFSNDVVMLVPYYAHSAGSLMCFCGDSIRLGQYATLSPIDITLEDPALQEPIILGSVDAYMDFVAAMRQMVEDALQETHESRRKSIAGSQRPMESKVEESMMTELIKQVGALRIGELFRERTLTTFYAQRLLRDYMLKNSQEEEITKIINKMVFDAPSHEFVIDYHVASDWDLPVNEMKSDEFKKTKALIDLLVEMDDQRVVYRPQQDEPNMPWFRFYMECGR